MSFQERIDNFYNWFVSNEVNIRHLMDDMKYDQVNEEMLSNLKEVFPNVVFQVSKKEGMYYLELLPMHDDCCRILYFMFINNAPPALSEKWKFYNCKQPKKGIMTIGNFTLRGAEVITFPIYDKKANKFKLKIVCHQIETMSDEEKQQIIYAMLYEYVGEILTESCISEVEFINKFAFNLRYKDYESIPLTELEGFIKESLEIKKSEELVRQGLIYTNYSRKVNKSDKQNRYDIENGYSAYIDACEAFYQRDNSIKEELKTKGCKLIYYKFMYKESMKNEINNIKNLIHQSIQNRGCLIGVANAKNSVYFDVLVSDDIELSSLDYKGTIVELCEL